MLLTPPKCELNIKDENRFIRMVTKQADEHQPTFVLSVVQACGRYKTSRGEAMTNDTSNFKVFMLEHNCVRYIYD
jgi:hypothetical protein